jgi:hypothetical protein
VKPISINLSLEQIEVLVTLADNQIFRMKYIDPKLPGHKPVPEALETARTAVQALQEALKTVKGLPTDTLNQRRTAVVRVSLGS